MRSESGVVAGTCPDSVQRLTIGLPSTNDHRYASRLPCAATARSAARALLRTEKTFCRLRMMPESVSNVSNAASLMRATRAMSKPWNAVAIGIAAAPGRCARTVRPARLPGSAIRTTRRRRDAARPIRCRGSAAWRRRRRRPRRSGDGHSRSVAPAVIAWRVRPRRPEPVWLALPDSADAVGVATGSQVGCCRDSEPESAPHLECSPPVRLTRRYSGASLRPPNRQAGI